jgi:hypothetical protein
VKEITINKHHFRSYNNIFIDIDLIYDYLTFSISIIELSSIQLSIDKMLTDDYYKREKEKDIYTKEELKEVLNEFKNIIKKEILEYKLNEEE